MSPALQLGRQFAIPAAQIQDRRLRRQPHQGPQDPRLQPGAGFAEGLGEALIEFAVERQQAFEGRLAHQRIIGRMEREQAWSEARSYSADQLRMARAILEELRAGGKLSKAVRAHPLPSGGYVPKHVLVHTYRRLVRQGEWPEDPALLSRIRMKPVRTLSGVTTVTVLTKPYPCPGKCIFCPTDVRMPKCYLPDEPGAMRALQHDFDPYEQTASRLAGAGSHRPSHRQDRAAHPGRHLELLPRAITRSGSSSAAWTP